MSEPVVTVSHLNKRFGSNVIIENLSFHISPGERVAFFAPSGAGKTTLIQIIAGLQTADSGSVKLNTSRPVVIFQEHRLFPYLTIEENIFLPFKVQDRPVTDQARSEFDRWMEVCELTAYKRHYPHQLSGGMKQKASIVRGFLQNPAFVLMDEPFQSIGRDAKKKIIQHIQIQYPDMTMLLVTHDLEEVHLLTQFLYYFRSNHLGKPLIVDTTTKTLQPVCFPWLDVDQDEAVQLQHQCLTN